MKIRRLNEDASRFYIDEIVSAQGGRTETERHSFSTLDELKQYCKEAGLTKDDIANCGGCDVEDLFELSREEVRVMVDEEFSFAMDELGNASLEEYQQYFRDRVTEAFIRCSTIDLDEIVSDYYSRTCAAGCIKEEFEKLHTKPNGEYLVKADSGKGYTAFSRDNVAIGGIDNEDADSDDKAIDKFKRNEYSECLNEAYFDTAEYRIQKYEDDIPELMAGMHDDYMEGKLDAARYAEVLKKVYDALAECDYKHTMSAPVVSDRPSNKILDKLRELDEKVLTENAEKCYAAKYTVVDSEGNKTKKKICFMCDGTIEDAEKLADELIKEPYSELNIIGSVLKSSAEKDGFVFVEEDTDDVEYDEDDLDTWPWKKRVEYEQDRDWDESYFLDSMFSDVAEKAFAIVEAEGYTDVFTEPSTQMGQGADFYWATKDGVRYTGRHDFQDQEEGFWSCCEEANSREEAIELMAKYYASNILSALEPEDEEDYDDDYSNGYDESLDECSGIRAHKIIMGEDIDDSIEFDDLDDVEGPEGDKTEDIEFVMNEYVSDSFLLDFVEKVDALTYKVGSNDQVVTVVFDPKWSEYVYTIDGKGPYSHRSYEFISRDIYDYVMSVRSANAEYDDLEKVE